MHGFINFLIVLLHSLVTLFLQYCKVKTIQYNAMHKFVGLLDNPQFQLSVGSVRTQEII